MKDKPKYKPAPAKRPLPRQSSKSEDVPCDICQGNKATAVKSCLVCRESYCEIHLTPHLKDQVMTKHRLTDPATFVNSHLCRHHNMLLENFCKRERKPVCMKCIERDHRHHEIVPLEKESYRIKVRKRNIFNLRLSCILSHNNARYAILCVFYHIVPLKMYVAEFTI